jgi:hypothetical protein
VTKEIIFTGSNPTVDRQMRRLAASGKLRKIHSSIYTSNLTEPELSKKRIDFRQAAARW